MKIDSVGISICWCPQDEYKDEPLKSLEEAEDDNIPKGRYILLVCEDEEIHKHFILYIHLLILDRTK